MVTTESSNNQSSVMEEITAGLLFNDTMIMIAGGDNYNLVQVTGCSSLEEAKDCGKLLSRKKFIESKCTLIYVIDKDASLHQQRLVKTAVVDVLNWDETGKVIESFGPIDHVINNAGIPEPEDILEVISEGIDTIFGVNFKALVNVSQVAAKGMINQGKGGTIVNISSVLDDKAIRGVSMYSCTKAAVTMLTKALALELAPHNIRVNCVRPSVMITNFVSNPAELNVGREIYDVLTSRQIIKKAVTVEDTAKSVLFLCSGGSSICKWIGIIGGRRNLY